jgi:prevent-host-death family protein
MNTDSISIGAFEAKTKLSELLDHVSRGASYTITKHNKPVARLTGVEAERASRRAGATAEIRALRSRYRLKGLRVRKLREEGRA